MKVSGSILLDKRGAFPHVHEHNINNAVDDFIYMLEEARKRKDKLYYDSEEWESFHAYGYDPTNDYWKGLRSIAIEKLFISSNRLFTPLKIEGTDKFENKPMPRTLGGFMCDGCPKSDYIYDKSTIDNWHYQWFYDNPEKIDWSKSVNAVFPLYDKVITILRKELQKLKESPDSINKLEHSDKKYIKSVDLDRLEATQIVSKFYSLIMDHKAETSEKISYAIEIGSKICELNYYHNEKELEDLNKGNQSIVKIYSIKKEGKYHFLSIDKKHGRFEWCDEKGDHISEMMFDGELVQNSQDSNHSILYIEKWKRTYHK